MGCCNQIKIPPRGKIYSCEKCLPLSAFRSLCPCTVSGLTGPVFSFAVNEGNSKYFYPPVVKYLESIKFPAEGKSPYSSRYIGSMVADVHRTLLYGGIFGYPSDKKSKNGKLRLLYEAFPMAMLIEQVRCDAYSGLRRRGGGALIPILGFAFTLRPVVSRRLVPRGSWISSRRISMSELRYSWGVRRTWKTFKDSLRLKQFRFFCGTCRRSRRTIDGNDGLRICK